MVAMAAATASSQLIFSSKPCSPSRLCPFQLCVFDTKYSILSSSSRRKHVGGAGVRCMAVGEATTETKRKTGYELQTLTSWLLKQEQAGVIDAELTIVLSSISMACKQIASLVQRANISNLTGVQGAVNVQGEDQKKLDVVSNEVSVTRFLSLTRVILDPYIQFLMHSHIRILIYHYINLKFFQTFLVIDPIVQ